MTGLNETIKSLKNESFQFKPIKKIRIFKKSFCILPVASFKDKIVQEAIRIILEIVFDPLFSKDNHGFRKQKSCHSALHQIKKNSKLLNEL